MTARSEGKLIIETPERVELEFTLASVGNRFIAVAIDHLIQFGLILALVIIFGLLVGDSWKKSGSEMPNWLIAILIFLLFVVFVGYFIFFEWFWSGQTPGKRFAKLRVIRQDGRPITLWEAVARNLLRVFDAMPGFLIPIYSVGLISLFVSGRDQRFGDLFAGTVVVREKTVLDDPFQDIFTDVRSDPAFRREMAQVRFDANIDSIGEQEIEVVEEFLRRRSRFDERGRKWMAWRIALPLMIKIKPQFDPAGFTYEGFLEELLHRFHAHRRRLN